MRKIVLGLMVMGVCLLGSNAFAIEEVSSLSFGQEAEDIVVDGNYAYILTLQKEIKVVDISTPETPSLIASLTIAESYVQCLEKEGNFLYVGAFTKIVVINVQNPAAPVKVGQYQHYEWIIDIEAIDSIAYVQVSSHFLILNVSNPASPTFLSELQYVFGNRSDLEVVVLGHYAYVADFNTIKVIDVSVPTNPSIVHTITGLSDGVYELAISGNYLFAGVRYISNNNITVVDISDPLSANVVTSLPTTSTPLEVRPSGNYLYVGEENGLLEVFNVSNPAAPYFAGSFQYTDKLYEMNIQGNYAYVAANMAGLLILEKCLGNPPIAEAGDDVIADANEAVTLDGSNSYDSDGYLINYTWKRLPEGTIIYSGSNPTFETNALGRVGEVIELTVTDNDEAVASDTARIISQTTEDLQNQIDTIELTPGLQGEPGITPEEVAAMQNLITSLQQENAAQQQTIDENRYLLEQLPQLKHDLEELMNQSPRLRLIVTLKGLCRNLFFLYEFYRRHKEVMIQPPFIAE